VWYFPLHYHYNTIISGKALVNNMRLLKIIPIALVLFLAGVPLSSCASDSGLAPKGQVVTVQRGDLRVDITGIGNLALSQKVDLSFEMDGTVTEVLVKEADSVEEGQVLAKLDTSAWEEQLIGLEDKVIVAERNVTAKERAVTAAERKVTDAERAVTEAERQVTDAERQVTAKKLDLLQAQVNLNNAELALEKTEEESTDRLEIEIKELQVEIAKGRVEDAQIALENAAKEGIEDAQIAVEDAKVRLEDAHIAVEDAQIAVEDAQKALENAREALDEARKASPEVKAPFTGFITRVNVAGGDEVKKGTVATTIADPTKFEADIMVSEMNILQVKLGGAASVQVEAMQGVSLPATVTHVSPTAAIQSGVVNYNVKVELTSLQPITMQRQQARDNSSSANVTSGEISERMKQAVEEGRFTQEQVEEMMKQRQQTPAVQPRQTPAMSTEDLELTEGLTVTVSIITEERNDVLLVPIQAIISQGRETLVQVLQDDVIEERSVQVGISNWQYAEITSGLSEGEQVIVPQETATTPTTPQQQPQQGIPRDIQRILR
jgi:HlyD family secretion protein